MFFKPVKCSFSVQRVTDEHEKERNILLAENQRLKEELEQSEVSIFQSYSCRWNTTEFVNFVLCYSLLFGKQILADLGLQYCHTYQNFLCLEAINN